MKNLMKITICFSIILLFISCAETKSLFSRTKKPSEDECVKRLIAKDIDSNSRLREIPIIIESFSGGNIKLKISANNERPIADKIVLAIRRGESLQSIQKNDSSINFLIDFEKQLKRMSAVKSVSWTADEPCAPGFVCQTTGSSEKSADEDEVDALCAEYRN